MTTALQVSPPHVPRRLDRRGRRARRSASMSRSPATPPRRAAMAPEVNAWVVIQPDDTVVIRIARSEMGQGTLTGLAQLVAEELEVRLVEGHDRISDARPEPRAQPRLGQLLDRRQPRHPRVATSMCARAAPRRAMMLIQAAAERVEGAGRRVHAPPTASSRTRRRGRTTTYGKVAEAAAQARAAEGRQAEGPEGLEDRRQAAEAPRHGRQGHRQAGLRHRPQAARHAERRDQGLPGVRRQGEELRRRQGRRACRA